MSAATRSAHPETSRHPGNGMGRRASLTAPFYEISKAIYSVYYKPLIDRYSEMYWVPLERLFSGFFYHRLQSVSLNALSLLTRTNIGLGIHPQAIISTAYFDVLFTIPDSRTILSTDYNVGTRTDPPSTHMTCTSRMSKAILPSQMTRLLSLRPTPPIE